MSSKSDLLPTPETPHPGGMSEAGVRMEPEPSALVARWEEAQATALSGKPLQLHPRELGFWSGRFSAEEMDELVIPKRTLARRRARREPLTIEETDKAFRLARISSEADRVFGDPAKAARWLRMPNAALAGNRPLDLLKSETGSRAVDELLGQIDHGMFN
jgi:putative toxin-antitoxin system antitoxin component (TIGR02293 family)